MASRPCPDVALIRWLAAGTLPAPQLGKLARHLAGCARCSALYEAEVASLVESIRSSLAAASGPAEPAVAGLIARLEKLPYGTTADGDSPTPARGVWGSLKHSPERPGIEVLLGRLSPAESADELGGLGRYRLLRLIGSGGMGAVFDAYDPVLRRRVAVKVILPASGLWDEQHRLRILAEARAAAALFHDNVMPVYEVAEAVSIPYLVMPLLKGESLAARLARAPRQPLATALQVARETAEGLAAAHAAGLVHRDLKPENLWLEQQAAGMRVRILDFGLACRQDEVDADKRHDVLLGTPQYMAPEQARGEPVDARADLFSLGCVLYQMLTGLRPIAGGDVTAALREREVHTPPATQDLGPSVPGRLADMVTALSAKRPDDRPASAAEVAARLRQLEAETASEAISAEPESDLASPSESAVGEGFRDRPAERPWRSIGHVVRTVGLGMAALAILALLLIRWARTGPKEESPPDANEAIARAHEILDSGTTDDGELDVATLWLARAIERTPADDMAAQRSLRLELFAAGPGRKPVHRWPHSDDVYGLAFSPDGQRLLTGCHDGKARVWDVATGGLHREFGHAQRIVAVAYRPGGKQIATGESETCLVRLWDVETGKLVVEPFKAAAELPGGVVYGLAFSPDGNSLLVGSGAEVETGAVALWDVHGPTPIRREVERSGHAVTGVAWLPDGSEFLATGNGQVRFWRTTTRQPSRSLRLDGGPVILSTPSLCGDGSRLVTGNWYGDPFLWRLPSGSPKEPFKHGGPNNEQFAAALSPDGCLVACGGASGRLSIWDVAACKRIGRPIPLPAMVRAIQFSPDGEWLAASVGKDGVGEVVVCRAPRPVDLDGRRVGSWAKLVTRMELGDDGVPRRMSEQEIGQLRCDFEATDRRPVN